jgi:hypothetical protein
VRPRLRLALVAAATSVAPTMGSAQPLAYPPFSFAEVDFAPDCTPNAAFDRLLGVLGGRSATSGDATVDEPLYDAVSGAALHVLQLRREVPWHGLRLVGVRFYHGVESGPANLSLLFADAPERVRAVWNERGWKLPPPGETRLIEDRGIAAIVGVDSDGQLASVTCFRD